MLDRIRRRLAHPALALVLPLALTVAAYWRVLDGEFQYDDGDAVETNAAVKDLAGFVASRLVPAWLGGDRAVTDLTFAWNHAVGGLVPWNFHLTNLAIHLATVVLIWAFAGVVMGLAGAPRPRGVAIAIAGVFALHPIQSEAVSYVSQRSECLASAFYVAALLLVVSAERRGLRWRAAPLWGAALATFAAALGSKPIAVTMPAAWFLLMAVVPAPERRSELLSWRRRLVAALPFAALDALFISRVLSGISGSGDAGLSVEGLPPWTYFVTQLRVIALYLRLLAWPVGQNVDWDFPVSRGLAEPAVWLSALFLLGLAAGAVVLLRAARRWGAEDAGAARIAGFGVLWFFIVLSVTSSFVPLADVVAEHRLYLASWGVFAAAAVGAERLLAQGPTANRVPIAAALVALTWGLSASALHRRNAVWETRRALWRDAVSKSPQKARAWFNLAHAALREGELEESIRINRMALELARGNLGLEVQILANLGGAQVLLGRPDQAEATLRWAVESGRANADVLVDLAAALLAQDRGDEAEEFATRAVVVSPEKGQAWSALGEVVLRRGDPAQALQLFERAADLEPYVAVRQFDRGRALAALGRTGDACRVWANVRAGDDEEVRAAVTLARAEKRCDARE